MTWEQMERTMQFILEHQAAFDARSAEYYEKSKASSEALEAEFRAIAEITRGLVEVARIHSRRLDRLDGLTPT